MALKVMGFSFSIPAELLSVLSPIESELNNIQLRKIPSRWAEGEEVSEKKWKQIPKRSTRVDSTN